MSLTFIDVVILVIFKDGGVIYKGKCEQILQNTPACGEDNSQEKISKLDDKYIA